MDDFIQNGVAALDRKHLGILNMAGVDKRKSAVVILLVQIG